MDPSENVKQFKGVQLEITGKPNAKSIGTLEFLQHEFVFIPLDEGPTTSVCYSCVQQIDRKQTSITNLFCISLLCKHYLILKCFFTQEKDALDCEELMRRSQPTKSKDLYAFQFKPSSPYSFVNGWDMYDPIEEYKRLGVQTKSEQWRFSSVNEKYELCATYPSLLVVPAKISDHVLRYASKFRSKGRIPSLSYLHSPNMCTITRSSQPMVGLKKNRSLQDEKLIESIFLSNCATRQPSSKSLIIDARPTANAVANVAKGAGTEAMEHYKYAVKVHMGIDNIHVMRDSLYRLLDAIQDGGNSKLHPAKLSWMRHIKSLLDSALVIIKGVHLENNHTLVHCSDGWDRTSQLVSIPEMCMDPYYRTIQGFEILIAKDWLSFGHKFSDRCGHLSNLRDSSEATSSTNVATATFNTVQNHLREQEHVRETSPVFQQFLECVLHIMLQYPTRFQFNQQFLLALHLHSHSCQFGTFLGCSEKERNEMEVRTRTYSVWDDINSNMETYLNPSYDEVNDRESNQGVILYSTDKVHFWGALYGLSNNELISMDTSNASFIDNTLAWTGTTSSSAAGEGNNANPLGMNLEAKVRDGSQMFKSLFDRTTASLKQWTGPTTIGMAERKPQSLPKDLPKQEGQELQTRTPFKK